MSDVERTFDWFPSQDNRSEQYRLGSAGPSMCTSTATYKRAMRTKKVWLDQGREGACTGFGSEHALALTPRSKVTTNEWARAVYLEARRQDEWPGEDYEGSSVNGAMKAERLLGRIRGWLWARTMQEVKHGLSYHGAGVMGSEWWSGMYNTDMNGYVCPNGQVVGGHAYAIAGFETLKDGRVRYRIDNSWGPDWGVQGSAWIWEPDLAVLLPGGEMAFPQKVSD